jgi:hypothetical protein
LSHLLQKKEDFKKKFGRGVAAVLDFAPPFFSCSRQSPRLFFKKKQEFSIINVIFGQFCSKNLYFEATDTYFRAVSPKKRWFFKRKLVAALPRFWILPPFCFSVRGSRRGLFS